MATSLRILFFAFVLLASSYMTDGKKAKGKKIKVKYTLPLNRTVEEELYSVKQTVMTVRQDLHDIMRDVKGLNRIFRDAENRLSELERIITMAPESENEDKTHEPSAQALTSNKPNEAKNSKKPMPGEGMPPKFLDKVKLPNHVTVTEGETASLRCPASGKPQPRIMWLKNNILFARKQGMTEAIKWKLLLRNMVLNDRGNYTCFIKNRYGQIQHTFILDVKEMPKTTRKPRPSTDTTTTPLSTETTDTTTTTRRPKHKTASPRPPQRSAMEISRSKPRYGKLSKKKKATKAPPRNQMGTEAPPIRRIPSAIGSRGVTEAPPIRRIPSAIGSKGVTDSGEKCEAKIAANGNPPTRDCWDLKMYHCVDKSGLYNVSVDGKSYVVYCDMATDGGGWTVFQRRFNGNVNFNRNWEEYKNGFGRIRDGEFWWGNENLYVFTRDRRMRVRIDMSDEMNSTFVEYDGFWISHESDYYRLNVEGFRGRGGEAFLQPVWEEESHNNMMFSTKDRDRDGSLANCAAHFGGGWWYNDCYAANLNGVYPRPDDRKTPSLQWKPWKGAKKYLTGVEMKIRPAIAPTSVTWDFWYPEKDDSFILTEYYRIHGGCC
ncbi:angiopoietin-related protein 6-like [Liolophura sinensis]|uniref:angiopoietin-related protein 6-like n=1 Tax=Liolophura sinensis TaxID=3198878 RepID=UPI0031589721